MDTSGPPGGGGGPASTALSPPASLVTLTSDPAAPIDASAPGELPPPDPDAPPAARFPAPPDVAGAPASSLQDESRTRSAVDRSRGCRRDGIRMVGPVGVPSLERLVKRLKQRRKSEG